MNSVIQIRIFVGVLFTWYKVQKFPFKPRNAKVIYNTDQAFRKLFLMITFCLKWKFY